MLSIFCSPCRYTQGRNATQALGSEMAALGLAGPVLILASKSAESRLSAMWAQALPEAGFAYSVRRFGGECSLAEIECVKTEAQARRAKVIVGAGGGKTLDVARAVAADLGLAVVNCPTVASSDAPTSACSIIYTDDGAFLECRTYPKNPDLVLVDTQVIAQSPPRLLVAGMGDALATWFEAKACAESRAKNTRGGASTRSALALAHLCYRTLLEDGVDALAAIRAQCVTPAFERIVEANTLLSGLGFESSGLAAAHAIHNGLTAVPETHAYLHGEKVAFGALAQLVLEGQPHTLIEETLGFSTSVGLPVTLAEIGLAGITSEMLDRVAARCTVEGELIHNEPFKVTPGMAADAIRAADAIGREWLRAHARPQ